MVHKKPRVLIIDGEPTVCDVLHDELSERGYLCTTALDGNEALTKLVRQDFDVVLLDIRLPDVSGMEVLSMIQSAHHNTATIMITAVNNVDTAVEAMKLGASDYIVKPFQLDRVNTTIRTVLENKKRSPKGRDKPTTEEPFSRMNAIVRGVEARFDSLFGYSKMVTQETIDIARQLGIPKKEIQRWAALRTRHDAKRNAAIKSLLNKLERSPLAQKILGMTLPHRFTPKPDESHN